MGQLLNVPNCRRGSGGGMTMLQHFLTTIRAMSDDELITTAKEDMRGEPDAIIDALFYELRARFSEDKRKALYAEMVTD